jgi:hypothetical protein
MRAIRLFGFSSPLKTGETDGGPSHDETQYRKAFIWPWGFSKEGGLASRYPTGSKPRVNACLGIPDTTPFEYVIDTTLFNAENTKRSSVWR